MAEFTRNNDRPESASAEGSAAVGQIQGGRVPTAVREASPAAVGKARNIAARRETIFREDAPRNLGRGGTALPAEVGSTRSQPDQPVRAEEWGAYPGGELGGGFDLPLSRYLAFDHTAVPSFRGLKPEFNPWTRDARVIPQRMSDPPQYIPVGAVDTQLSVLVARGLSRENVLIHTLAWNFLSTALKSNSDKSMLHRCTSPRQAWDALFEWVYGPQTTGAPTSLRRFNSFNIAPASNPLEEMGRIEDLATEVRIAGLSVDVHMLYCIF